jgi:opacity protein-like surface antigen
MENPSLPSTRQRCAARLLVVLLLALVHSAQRVQAQAHSPTASRTADLQLGGGYALAAPDYGPHINGFTFYGSYDFREHLGVEFDFHQVNSRNGNDLYERTYEVGPRYVLHFRPGLNPYIRVMYGRGVFNFPDGIANLAYNMAVAGGGVDVNVQKHVNLRADYEYQRWFGFPPHDLMPQIVTIGAAYHF